jgi:hypothetical protein
MFSVFTGAGLDEGDAGKQQASRRRTLLSGSTNPKKTLGMIINQPTYLIPICIIFLLATLTVSFYADFEEKFGYTEETAM